MKRLGFLVITFALLAACGGDEATSNNNNNGTCTPTLGGVEACDGVDNDCDGEIDEDFPDLGESCSAGEGLCQASGVFVCSPDLTEAVCDAEALDAALTCTPDVCGMVDDGCGGTIDCGECPCADGVPTSETCGTCDLGTQTCGANETGAGVCVRPRGLDSLEGADCDAGFLYVTASATAGTGTQADPFGSIQDAIDAASAGQAVLVRSDDGVYAETIVLKNGVHVFGGYLDEWKYTTTEEMGARAPRAELVLQSDNSLTVSAAVQAIDITDETWLSMIHGELGGSVQGRASYGLYAVRADGLRVEHSDFPAQPPLYSMQAGTNGVNGDPGGNGESAFRSTLGGLFFEDCVDFIANAYSVIPGNYIGDAGENASCPQANGGAGGEGQSGDSTTGSFVEINANTSGQAAAAGTNGGPRGLYIPVQMITAPGGDGDDGMAELAAAGGTAAANTFQVANDQLENTTQDGGTGTTGAVGAGGGGGGGSLATQINPTQFSLGNAGGGGGAGGCGGTGGGGGLGVPPMVGLFALDSDLQIFDSTFSADGGPNGNAGGNAGVGGAGGSGGTGANSQCQSGFASPYIGGAGGDGAPGQDGGGGAGGAGGSVFGGYCVNSNITVENTEFTASNPGTGGAGGMPNGPAGADGTAENEVDCL